MSIYYSDHGKQKKKRKTNKGANQQFAGIVNDVVNYPYNIPLPPAENYSSTKENELSEWNTENENREQKNKRDHAEANATEQQAWLREQATPDDRYGQRHKIVSVLSVLIPLILVSAFFVAWIASVN